MSDHSAGIECRSLIRHCKDCLSAWLEQDIALSGTVYPIVVPADFDYGNLQYNAKFLTDEELDRYVNDSDIDVHRR